MLGIIKAIREHQAVARDLGDVFDEFSNWAIHQYSKKLGGTVGASMATAILCERERRQRYGEKFGGRFFGEDMLSMVSMATNGKELIAVLKGILFAIEQDAKRHGESHPHIASR
jgi:hypothetical protein